MWRKFFARSGGSSVALDFTMGEEAIISVFVDESGNLSCARDSSRFYIVSLVVHNQADSIGDLVQGLDTAYAAMGFPNLCFHAGPLIRREDGYEYMSWELRSRIFSKMMAFARKAPFRDSFGDSPHSKFWHNQSEKRRWR